MSKTARKKVMDLLAKRSHSELELRQKLEADPSEYAPEDIDDALQAAIENKWLMEPSELSALLAEELRRKGKGLLHINQVLESKGLPPVPEDSESDLDRAKQLLASKLGHDFESAGQLPEELEAKAQRLLMNRGFDEETISKLIPSRG
ncbi:MAG: regulatory protein RecX [Proteobacteria bacterium]|nr:MAG: regulatory protein RecX [Pseudomonadota bacterium]